MKRRKKLIKKSSKYRARPRRPQGARGRTASAHREAIKRRRPATIKVYPWPADLPTPSGAAPGTIAVFARPYRVRRKVARRWRIFEYVRSVYYLFPAKPPPPIEWLTCHEYMDRVEAEKEFAGHRVLEKDMEIYRKNLASDVVHIKTRFVWSKSSFPYRIKVYGQSTPFIMIRVWFWVYPEDQADDDQREYRLWCRTTLLEDAVNFKGLSQIVGPFYETIVRDVPEQSKNSKTTPHTFIVDGLVAWTGYLGGEKAPHKKREGGTE